MKTKIKARQLSDALAITAPICGRKVSMPILTSVLIESAMEVQRIFVTADSLDLRVSTSFPADVAEDGSICIPARRFQAIVNSLATLEATMDTNLRCKLTLKSGPSTFNIMGMDKLDFPKQSVLEGEPTFTMKQTVLDSIFNAVEAAQSEDETRYLLNAVYIHSTANALSFVATDGRRMHVYELPPVPSVFGCILPRSTVQTLRAMLDGDGEVSFLINERKAQITLARKDGPIFITSKLIEGNYPNYKQVIPKQVCAPLKIKTEDLSGAVRRVMLALDEKNTAVNVEMAADSIRFSGSSPDNGEADETIPCENPDKITGKIGINGRFLTDAVGSVDIEAVQLHVNPTALEVSPVMVQAENTKMVIMPVRLT